MAILNGRFQPSRVKITVNEEDTIFWLSSTIESCNCKDIISVTYAS